MERRTSVVLRTDNSGDLVANVETMSQEIFYLNRGEDCRMNFILAIGVGPLDGIHFAGGFGNLVQDDNVGHGQIKARVKALIRMRYLT